MTPVDPLFVASFVAEALEQVELRYVIGGSVAASLVGEPRSTLGLDVMIESDVQKTRDFVALLEPSCYVDSDAAIAAATNRGTFNVIHYESSMKIDFFVAEDERFAEEALLHRRAVQLPGRPVLYFYAAEDLIVRKLQWFRLGNEVSERQWRDVVSMLRLNQGRLDLGRLDQMAQSARVEDLLVRARETAG